MPCCYVKQTGRKKEKRVSGCATELRSTFRGRLEDSTKVTEQMIEDGGGCRKETMGIFFDK